MTEKKETLQDESTTNDEKGEYFDRRRLFLKAMGASVVAGGFSSVVAAQNGEELVLSTDERARARNVARRTQRLISDIGLNNTEFAPPLNFGACFWSCVGHGGGVSECTEECIDRWLDGTPWEPDPIPL